jgi:hypothetical protein
MRSITLCGLAAAFTASAFAQQTTPPGATPSDTLKAVLANGQTMSGSMQGMELTYKTTFAPDGTYRSELDLMNRVMTGRWRIEGDKLCTTGDGNPIVDCTAYPPGKKSGDTFQVEHPRLGPAKVTIN